MTVRRAWEPVKCPSCKGSLELGLPQDLLAEFRERLLNLPDGRLGCRYCGAVMEVTFEFYYDNDRSFVVAHNRAEAEALVAKLPPREGQSAGPQEQLAPRKRGEIPPLPSWLEPPTGVRLTSYVQPHEVKLVTGATPPYPAGGGTSAAPPPPPDEDERPRSGYRTPGYRKGRDY